MAKLTKNQARMHAKAQARLAGTAPLTLEDIEYVLTHWQEGASYLTTTAGAFFTPLDLAADAAFDVYGAGETLRVLDLCAGIGAMSAGVMFRHGLSRRWAGLAPVEFVCVEANPDYVAVGKKILPDARWITGDVFALPDGLGRFDCVIANPPFGRTPKRAGSGPRYTGAEFEYHVIDIAAQYAPHGVFILPQTSAPFRYSGLRGYAEQTTPKLDRFARETGITLGDNIGIDCAVYRDQWHGISPAVEVVTADLTTAKPLPAPSTLFELVA